MNNIYEEPSIEIINFDTIDVIRTSNFGDDLFDNEDVVEL